MKYAKYLLLLLLTVSCASHKSVRQRSLQADIRPDVPLEVQTTSDSQTLSNSPVEGENSLLAKEDWREASWQAVKQRALDSLCGSPIFETTQLGMYVYDLTDGQPLYAVNAAQRMRPASCQKIVTAVTALDCLTGDYQLQTDFRITGTVTGGVLNGDLYVVGGMDPLVTASELLQAAATIKQQQGIERIAGNIIYDLSMREDAPLGWGWCWDDDYGPLSALLVDGKATFEQNWTEALRKAGIKTPSNSPVKGENKKSPFKGDLEGLSVCSIRHGIDDLLVPMMKNSDNIYAECLFYQIAAQTGQKYAGHKQAAGYTEELMRRIGLDPDQYRVADGSGLSLYNYVSAEMLVAMLCHAWRTPGLRDHLLPSLPIAGFDGTLQKRLIGTAAEGNVRAKTGTVTGVVSLAGYLTTANGHTLAFAIINQGVPSSSIGRAFQDEVCEELCK
ncbi:MAG: D-alanyl-D-alanine carboxypeptidase/D-alanyl-D-alanine-endopeptidase [Bacteroidaceae bacterium]|nr:D-alanyl-D-alanine carboxypeptidase/D-alanyl-D-alanine-endopeptidase [Bacteroidaceae bacterium]